MAGEEKRQACYSLGSVLLKGTIARDVGTTGAYQKEACHSLAAGGMQGHGCPAGLSMKETSLSGCLSFFPVFLLPLWTLLCPRCQSPQ